jgi:hypothetical protein
MGIICSRIRWWEKRCFGVGHEVQEEFAQSIGSDCIAMCGMNDLMRHDGMNLDWTPWCGVALGWCLSVHPRIVSIPLYIA